MHQRPCGQHITNSLYRFNPCRGHVIAASLQLVIQAITGQAQPDNNNRAHLNHLRLTGKNIAERRAAAIELVQQNLSANGDVVLVQSLMHIRLLVGHDGPGRGMPSRSRV